MGNVEKRKPLIFDANADAAHLKNNGVTFEQIGEELEYRGNANITEPEPDCHTCGWDDALCEYSTAELEEIMSAWDNSNQGAA